jgi:putative Ca2+/H+ antiporter (TMEM165/GDT1 family)
LHTYEEAINFLTDAIEYLKGEREGATPSPDPDAALEAIGEARAALVLAAFGDKTRVAGIPLNHQDPFHVGYHGLSSAE